MIEERNIGIKGVDGDKLRQFIFDLVEAGREGKILHRARWEVRPEGVFYLLEWQDQLIAKEDGTTNEA